MKKLFLILFTSFNLMAGYGQQVDIPNRTRYGIEASQFLTGSGFAMGTEIFVTVIPDNRKRLSLGLFYCSEQKKISGFTMHHEISLVRYPSSKKFVPYAFYNMIYRFSRANDKNENNRAGLYKSFEHHLGIGLDMKITSDFSIKAGLGYGVYFGSIKKPVVNNSATGEITGSNGFSAIGKLGLIYTF